MLTIDELNTISLDMLNRFGNRDEQTDMFLLQLSVNVIVCLCSQHEFKLDSQLYNAAKKVIGASGSTQEKTKTVRETTLPPKATDDIDHSGNLWEQCQGLLHFGLYNESAAFLGDDVAELDFLFVRELIGLAVTAKHEFSEEKVGVGDVADAIFLADILVSWAGYLAAGCGSLDIATSAVQKSFLLTKAGVFQTSQADLSQLLPPKTAT